MSGGAPTPGSGPRRRLHALAADAWIPRVAAVAAGLLYLRLNEVDQYRPIPGMPASGWSGWFDAGWYLRSALAWSRLDFSPDQHWYPAGYPILGALGMLITPEQPFLLPDLACLTLSLLLFAALASEVAGRAAGMRAAGALVFLCTTCLNPTLLEVWVEPWTTSPAAAAIYAALLAALRFAARPRAATSAAVGLSGGAIALFRPTEAALTLGCAAIAMLAAAARLPRVSFRRRGAFAAAGFAGSCLPLAALFASELVTGGFRSDGYLAVSAHYGFEWRLLPLRWVEIFVDPRPLWPGLPGLSSVFPWIAPGVIGMAAVLARARGAAFGRHALLVGAVALHCCVFLTYRDLAPSQLWDIFLYHYFKWALPVMGLCAALLPWSLAAVRGRRACVAAVAAASLFLWRPELRLTPGRAPAVRLDDGAILLSDGLASIDSALLAPARGPPGAIFHGEHEYEADGRIFKGPFDVRAFPRPGGLLLVPLRPLPRGAATIRFVGGVAIGPGAAVAAAERRLAFGAPCWLDADPRRCDPLPTFPPAALEPGRVVDWETGSAAYAGDGWGGPEPGGRWTTDRRATIGVRLEDADRRDMALYVTGHGWAEEGGQAPDVTVVINNQQVASWRPAAIDGVLAARIPAALLEPGGVLSIRLAIPGARAPTTAWEPGEKRKLGLFVRSLTLAPIDGPAERQP